MENNNNNTKPGVRITRTAVTPERTLESIIRANMFTLEDPRKRFAKAYQQCNCENMDPHAIFMARSLDLIKMISGPMQGSNRKPKNLIATDCIETLLDMRGAMESSAHIEKLEMHYAKECSRFLFIVKADLDALCGMDYISSTFFYKTHEVISDLNFSLVKWIEVLSTHAYLKKLDNR